MKLYARQQGQGSDLISIHGLFGSQDNLGVINRHLSGPFRVHALDVRNHGHSPHSDTMTYSAMAGDILEYLDEQRLEQVDLLGHSMGGKIAMTLALQAPQRVRKLVVLDIAPVSYAPRHDRVLAGLNALDLTAITRRSEADRQLQPFVQEPAIRQFLLKNLSRDTTGGFRWRINLKSITAHYQNIMAGQQADSGFQGETLFIKGACSDYILPEHKDQILALFPRARVRVIAATGHWLHAEKPVSVARSIQRFLAPSP